MNSIQLKNVTKSYHGELIFDKLNLTIPSGQFFALLGPSGSGKTTLLRLLAGFESPDAGRIYLKDKDITNTPVNERTINTVFQHYALFPHLNVFENVAYGLRIKKFSEEVIAQKVHKVLQAVHLEKQIYKSINQLSGGQKQRVALARAIVNEPDVLLFDEPLAALDAKLRERMLVELIELQSTLKTTFVYVTHDQTEALTVADTMAIMNEDGEIEQVGTPREIYEFPASSFVARFVGTTNIFSGNVCLQEGLPYIDISKLGIFAVSLTPDKIDIMSKSRVMMSLRPEKIMISKQPREGFSNHIEGIVNSIIYYGRSTQYNVLLQNDMIVHVFEQNDEHFANEEISYDDKVHLYWQKDNVVLLTK